MIKILPKYKPKCYFVRFYAYSFFLFWIQNQSFNSKRGNNRSAQNRSIDVKCMYSDKPLDWSDYKDEFGAYALTSQQKEPRIQSNTHYKKDIYVTKMFAKVERKQSLSSHINTILIILRTEFKYLWVWL